MVMYKLRLILIRSKTLTVLYGRSSHTRKTSGVGWAKRCATSGVAGIEAAPPCDNLPRGSFVPNSDWPELPLAAWKDTYATLHMWTQIVGKTRLALSPPVNHWWHVPFYVSARGLSTSPIPAGARTFEAEFDFVSHNLSIRASDGQMKFIPLYPRSVADFYREFVKTAASIGIEVKIWKMPVEIPDP